LIVELYSSKDREKGSLRDMQLDSLPTVLIEKVLLHLKHPKDIINIALSSQQFKHIALSDIFWLRVLLGRWGNRTQPSEWLTDSAMGHFELLNSKHNFPGSYR
jgi:hypothetical protein